MAALQLTDILEDQENVSFSEGFRQLAYDLRHPEEFQLPSLQVEAELRDYQELGVKWLSMLNHYGFGGILADDMGLGKTLANYCLLTAVLRV